MVYWLMGVYTYMHRGDGVSSSAFCYALENVC